MKRIAILSACAALSVAMIANADAQGRRGGKNATSITLTNKRTAALNELEVTTAGDPPVIVAKLAKPIAPGKSATLAIKGKRGCMFAIRGAYADDATVENDDVDLCKDSKLRLNE